MSKAEQSIDATQDDVECLLIGSIPIMWKGAKNVSLRGGVGEPIKVVMTEKTGKEG